MIRRIWHGWARRENADAYEALLKSEIFPDIRAKKISGYRGIVLLRQEGDEEVAFVTIMTFDSLESVKGLAGDDPTVSYVPAKARELLSRWDERAQHYEVREEQRF